MKVIDICNILKKKGLNKYIDKYLVKFAIIASLFLLIKISAEYLVEAWLK